MMSERALLDKSDPTVLLRLNELVRRIGTHKEAADKSGMAYATLQRMLAGKSAVTQERIEALAAVAGVTVDSILSAEQTIERLSDRKSGFGHFPAQVDIIGIPALNIQAAAGDGSLAVGERLDPGPFHFSGAWLRTKFGTIAGLKLVQVKGDSQEPDMHGGDWVLIDESRNEVENGLAVVRLDDCLMIKRLQREGHMLRLMSRNDQYRPIEIDLQRDEERLRVIGRAVFMMKAL